LVTFRYDLVNLGRELMAQLATPVSMNFHDSISAGSLDKDKITATGNAYIELLEDIDTLVGADNAFLLGSWIQTARYWGANSTDCDGNIAGITNCPDFYEWNARVQLTSWNPTPKGAAKIPGGPNDYASKHWNGLIKDYYGARAKMILKQALSDASQHRPLNQAAVDKLNAGHAYSWSTATNKYPETVVGDALKVSKAMLQKYTPSYAACSQTNTEIIL